MAWSSTELSPDKLQPSSMFNACNRANVVLSNILTVLWYNFWCTETARATLTDIHVIITCKLGQRPPELVTFCAWKREENDQWQTKYEQVRFFPHDCWISSSEKNISLQFSPCSMTSVDRNLFEPISIRRWSSETLFDRSFVFSFRPLPIGLTYLTSTRLVRCKTSLLETFTQGIH